MTIAKAAGTINLPAPSYAFQHFCPIVSKMSINHLFVELMQDRSFWLGLEFEQFGSRWILWSPFGSRWIPWRKWRALRTEFATFGNCFTLVRIWRQFLLPLRPIWPGLGSYWWQGFSYPHPTPGRGASQAGPPKNEIPRNFSVRIISHAAGVAVSSACVVHSMHCANDSSDWANIHYLSHQNQSVYCCVGWCEFECWLVHLCIACYSVSSNNMYWLVFIEEANRVGTHPTIQLLFCLG